MYLDIKCPNCGYNSYNVLNVKTNKEVIMTISKCEPTGCSLQIPEDNIFDEYETFSELQIFSEKRYKIIEMINSDCFD
ncbi:hypothetical protein SL053_002382 [Flavobacterium psychrophilum]|jgi:hypothetical protein|nr:hypothetical protein [Flavobacterium psychrophilum]